MEIKQRIKSCSHISELAALCRQIPHDAINATIVRLIQRALDKFSHLEYSRIAYLGNITFQPLPEFITTVGLKYDTATKHYIAPYNQIFQEALNPKSELYTFQPHLIVLVVDLRVAAPELVYEFYKLDGEALQSIQVRIIGDISQLAEIVCSQTHANIVVADFPIPAFFHYGVADQKREFSEYGFYNKLNQSLYATITRLPRVQVLPLNEILSCLGKRACEDRKMFYLAKIPWSEDANRDIAESILASLHAFSGISKKCIVLDLDNTLWGGILGEEGVAGISIDKEDPIGQAFRDFQHRLLALKHRGILLAICSKNNLEDVLEVFRERPAMPLRLEDFASIKVNWEMKHVNIAAISKQLNISLDSMVFIDDNPTEVELIKQMLPDVETICLPNDPANYSTILEQLPWFEKTIVTSEDREKTRQYTQNTQREELKSHQSVEDYLRTLETKVDIDRARAEHINRIHQLFTKTNQFNVTTVRYPLSQVEELLHNPDSDLFVVNASDRFGDLGYIGLVLVHRSAASQAIIDSFILSCRAMGRHIETAVMNFLKSWYFDQLDMTQITATYVPTSKNIPVERFFDSQGFTITNEEGGTRRYVLHRAPSTPLSCHWIKVTTRV